MYIADVCLNLLEILHFCPDEDIVAIIVRKKITQKREKYGK